jgi:23S rRNA pseudouridine2605 synthase
MKERIQKVMANNGVASRRESEKLLEQGLVFVNGKKAKLGDKISYFDKLIVDNLIIKLNKPKATKFIIYNKQEQEVCAKKDEYFTTVFSRIPSGVWHGVGRLDVNTTGLYVFTNSGDMANKLMHPSYNHKRVYLVKINRLLSPMEHSKIIAGVYFQGEKYKADAIKLHRNLGGNCWYKVTLSTGKNHEIKNIFSLIGAKLSKLKRVEFGPFKLPEDLPKGAYQIVNAASCIEYESILL